MTDRFCKEKSPPYRGLSELHMSTHFIEINWTTYWALYCSSHALFSLKFQIIINMQPSTRLLQVCRITLFTRANCSLCTSAKRALSNVWDSRPFVYKEIDVMTPERKNWKDLYEFDTPVVSLRISEIAIKANFM